MTSIGKLKDRARKHEQKEDWKAAIDAYRKVLETEAAGDEVELELGLFNRVGDLYLRIGQTENAVDYYEKAADKYAEFGFFNNAIALCNKALRHRPDRPDVFLKLSRYSREQGFLPDARRWIIGYAERQVKQGNVDAALAGLQEFADDSGDPAVRELLAQHLAGHERNADAVAQLRQAHAEWSRRGDEQAANRVAEQARALDPDVVLDALARDTPRAPMGLPGLDEPADADEVTLDAGPAPEVADAGGGLEGLETHRLDPSEDFDGAGVDDLDPTGVSPDAIDEGLLDDWGTGDVDEEPLPIIDEADRPGAGAGVDPVPDAGATAEIDEDEPEPLPLLDTGFDEEGGEEPDALPLLDFPEAAELDAEEVVTEEFEAEGLDPEEPAAAEPVVEEPVVEEIVAEEPIVEDFVVEEPVAEERVAEEPVAEEPVAEGPVAEEPVAEEPVAEEPVAEKPVAEEPVAEEPFAEEPVAEEEPVAASEQVDADDAVRAEGRGREAGGRLDLGAGFDVAGAGPAGGAPQTELMDLNLDLGSMGGGTGAPDGPETVLQDLDVEAVLNRAKELVSRGLVEPAFHELGLLVGSDAEPAAFRQALAVSNEIHRHNPDDLSVLQRRVEFADRIGDRAVVVGTIMDLAGALARSGAETKAQAMYQRVLALDPDHEPAREALGDAGLVDDAPVDLEAVLRDLPEGEAPAPAPAAPPGGDEDFAAMLSQFKARVGDGDGSEDAGDHYDLGLAFKEMGLIDEAIAEFRTALTGGEERLKVYEELGQCFILKGQYTIAIQVLKRGLQSTRHEAGDVLGVYYHLGQCYEELGQRPEARAAYERVLAIDPDFEDVPSRVARL